MLTGIHFLLTYQCTYECDHCFLHCSPSAGGTFTAEQLRAAFEQIDAVETINSVYFEGGEPFLFYPLLIEGVRLAKERNFSVGLVTNAYFATSEESARLWLAPLKELGIDYISVSDDDFHSGEESESPAQCAVTAAKALGISVGTICIEQPASEKTQEKGQPVVGGGVMIRGRAADTLLDGLARHDANLFDDCKFEELRQPSRLHLDPFGNLHLCQGVIVGNIWRTPLAEIIAGYDPDAHPIAGPILRGGPRGLADEHGITVDAEGYADACHLCYSVRKALMEQFPEELSPSQVYGL